MPTVQSRRNLLSPPRWAGEEYSERTLVRGGCRINPANFMAEDGAIITTAANAAQGATSITINPLIEYAALMQPINYAVSPIVYPAGVTSVPIQGLLPAGSVLSFGVGIYAKTTADAPYGSTTLAVEALPVAIASGATATYTGRSRFKPIPSGTLIGRSAADVVAGNAFSPADVVNHTQLYLLAFDITDANLDQDGDIYRQNSLVKQNYLPNWTGLATNVQTKIQSLYQCITGVN